MDNNSKTIFQTLEKQIGMKITFANFTPNQVMQLANDTNTHIDAIVQEFAFCDKEKTPNVYVFPGGGSAVISREFQ